MCYAHLEIKMDNALPVDIVNSLQDLFHKNPTSSFSQNKLILDDSVKKLPASDAVKRVAMKSHISEENSGPFLVFLLFCHEAHLVPPIVVSLVKLQNSGTLEAVHDVHLSLHIPPATH